MSDNATGTISAFTRDGRPVRRLDTGVGAGALQGLAIGPDGMVYVADFREGRALRVEP